MRIRTADRLGRGWQWAQALAINAIWLGIIMGLVGLTMVLGVGCATRPSPPVVTPQPVPIDPERVVAFTRDCRALWADELRREIDAAAMNDCVSATVAGNRSIEDFRAQIRASDEYAALHAAPPVPTLTRLRLADRFGLVNPAGVRVPWTAVTGFRLIDLVADGDIAGAERFLSGLAPARSARVLLMARWLFDLSPEAGLRALPATLALAERHGVYLEVTIFADTKERRPEMGYQQYAWNVGTICATSPACALLEIGNELHPLHETQDAKLGDVAYLRQLHTTLRESAPGVPVSLGSTHGDQDESDVFRDGDFLTIHGDRMDGDNGWRWVRHTNDQRALAERVNRWAVNDEPKRDDLSCDKQIAMGALQRMASLGDLFHYRDGLQAIAPQGAERDAFVCRARGWAAIPDDWRGSYQNAGFSGSPVEKFEGALRAYSSVNGSTAYTLVMDGAQARITWRDDWPSRTLVLAEGGTQLWRVTR